MNIEKSIENIVAKCDNYIDPQLAICIIRDNCTMGSNNIGELIFFLFVLLIAGYLRSLYNTLFLLSINNSLSIYKKISKIKNKTCKYT